MKTFEEALSLCLEKGSKEDSPEEIEAIYAKLSENQERYKQIHEQVRNTDESYIIAGSIMDLGEKVGLYPLGMLVLALAHGVCIGIEMEKHDS